MSRHEVPPIVGRIADVVHRHITDLRIIDGREAAEAAAYRVLADRDIADGQRARAVLAAIDTMHEPRTWGGHGAVVVCDRCNEEWPCETKQLLDSAQTPARLGSVPAGPSGLPTDEFAAVTA